VTQTRPAAISPQKPRPKPGRVWGAIFIVAGAALLGLGLFSAKLGFETIAWPRAEATFLDKQVLVSEDASQHNGTREQSIFTRVVYAYEAAGRGYTASGFERGGFGMLTEADSIKLAQRVSVGDKATIAYNPSNPAEAYLKPGVANIAYMIGGVGLFVLLLGVMMRASSRAGRRRKAAGASRVSP
jgi:hypothetical protein